VRDKELGKKWERAAASFLRRHPFCAECQRRGRDVPAFVVDHIVPRGEGGEMWDRANWQPLCNPCHNGLKRDLERLAVQMGDVRLLINWMAKPQTRPGRWAFVAAAVECDDAEGRTS
jgi:5-methylcytosine-specific restriction endonuclease McrA